MVHTRRYLISSCSEISRAASSVLFLQSTITSHEHEPRDNSNPPPAHNPGRMGGSKYAGVPSVADATAAVDDSGLAAFPPLAMATKVDQFVDEPNDGITVTWEKGEVQPSAYRDKWFAIAFVAHLVAVLGTGIAFGPAMWNNVTADVAESEKYPVDVDEDDGGNLYGASSSEIGTDTQEAPPKEFWFAVVAIALVSAPALSFAALTIMSR